MKKITIILLGMIAATSISFASDKNATMTLTVPSNSHVTIDVGNTDNTTDKIVNNQDDVHAKKQTKGEKLVGTNSASWTPKYLSVDDYKKCLDIQHSRGWEGYCMPKTKNENCPEDSWKKLQELNLVSCSTNK